QFPAFVLENLCGTCRGETHYGWAAPSPIGKSRQTTPGLCRNLQFAAPRCITNPGGSTSRQRSRHSPLSRESRHPGTCRAFPLFHLSRAPGARPPAGIHEMGTSPSCLALNTSGTRLYSANETDRVGEHKEGTASAFAINRADGKLELLNTVGSGGAGPTFVSVHPSGRFVLVANY